MNNPELVTKVQQVVSILSGSGFSGEAARLQGLLDALNSGSRPRHECLSEIEGLCGVKSFGDLYVKGIEYNSWMRLLSETRTLASEQHA